MADRSTTTDDLEEGVGPDELDELDDDLDDEADADDDIDLENGADEDLEDDLNDGVLEVEDLGGAGIDEAVAREDLDDLEPDEFTVVVAAATDTFDEDDLAPASLIADGDDDGLRAGEFVCRSCHLARRDTQLADSKRMLCRDCA
ncbi:MAG: hypothetical protein WD358_06365 [Nitriliruptoraceae bacterium]